MKFVFILFISLTALLASYSSHAAHKKNFFDEDEVRNSIPKIKKDVAENKLLEFFNMQFKESGTTHSISPTRLEGILAIAHTGEINNWIPNDGIPYRCGTRKSAKTWREACQYNKGIIDWAIDSFNNEHLNEGIKIYVTKNWYDNSSKYNYDGIDLILNFKFLKTKKQGEDDKPIAKEIHSPTPPYVSPLATGTTILPSYAPPIPAASTILPTRRGSNYSWMKNPVGVFLGVTPEEARRKVKRREGRLSVF